MPAKPLWLLQLPRIRHDLECLGVPVLDRAAFERLFGVRRRRAIQLMHCFGGYQAGRTFLIERLELLAQLESIAGGDDFHRERCRREKLVTALENARRQWTAARVAVPAAASAPRKLAELPAGLRLEPGRLTVEFYRPDELLATLFAFVQAVAGDYEQFLAAAGPPADAAAPDLWPPLPDDC